MGRCGECKFFHHDNGQCRRNAPIPMGHRQYAQWPLVEADDGCGQYQAAADAMAPLKTDCEAIAAE